MSVSILDKALGVDRLCNIWRPGLIKTWHPSFIHIQHNQIALSISIYRSRSHQLNSKNKFWKIAKEHKMIFYFERASILDRLMFGITTWNHKWASRPWLRPYIRIAGMHSIPSCGKLSIKPCDLRGVRAYRVVIFVDLWVHFAHLNIGISHPVCYVSIHCVNVHVVTVIAIRSDLRLYFVEFE